MKNKDDKQLWLHERWKNAKYNIINKHMIICLRNYAKENIFTVKILNVKILNVKYRMKKRRTSRA